MIDQVRPLPPDANDLASLCRKMAMVGDRVEGVALGFITGLYLYGVGGIGKSYKVLKHLEALSVAYVLFNSRMTAKGLYRALERAPDAIHVFEDMERLTADRDAQGVLRAALWAQPGHDRRVTWTTATGGEESFVFRGGIIIMANRPLADLPELRALATRIAVLNLEVADAEVAAQMRHLAQEGYKKNGKLVIDALQCGVIAEFIIEECKKAVCRPDLRQLTKAYHDYLQWEADHSSCGWQDLIASNIHEASHHFRNKVSTISREERQAERRNTLRLILRQTPDLEKQLELYQAQTDASRADFYRRKREINSGEFEVE